MTLILQWVVLAVCLACTIWRFVNLPKGHNRGLFWIFVCITICVALSIKAIYMPTDSLLGGRNLANVLLHLSLFCVFFLLAAKVAAAYNSPLGLKLIRGPAGLAALGICTAGLLVSYLLSDVQGSSAGLSGFDGQDSIQAYKWFGRAYMAYAAAVVIIPTAKGAGAARTPLDRLAALLLSVGFALVFATVPLGLLFPSNGAIITVASFASILFVAVGLALIWLSFMRGPLQAAETL